MILVNINILLNGCLLVIVFGWFSLLVFGFGLDIWFGDGYFGIMCGLCFKNGVFYKKIGNIFYQIIGSYINNVNYVLIFNVDKVIDICIILVIVQGVIIDLGLINMWVSAVFDIICFSLYYNYYQDVLSILKYFVDFVSISYGVFE